MFLPYNRKVTANAKKLRNNMTEEESKLWYQYLCRYSVKFLRQKVVENYILDFYCAKCMLGIEVDGGQHKKENVELYDEERTRFLKGYGVTVIRFKNEQVHHEFGDVCRQIDEKVKELMNKQID